MPKWSGANASAGRVRFGKRVPGLVEVQGRGRIVAHVRGHVVIVIALRDSLTEAAARVTGCGFASGGSMPMDPPSLPAIGRSVRQSRPAIFKRPNARTRTRQIAPRSRTPRAQR